uniref:Uncharacterized protein n=1 Tax=Sciurus vulgaris TaxID=55149 RepID=A0A8D2D0N9_SCIVU
MPPLRGQGAHRPDLPGNEHEWELGWLQGRWSVRSAHHRYLREGHRVSPPPSKAAPVVSAHWTAEEIRS